jgi:hypothetical protein
MGTEIVQHFWKPWNAMLRYVEQLASGRGRIVEIGPGAIPFGPATEFVDWIFHDEFKKALPAGTKTYQMNICSDPLPFEDKSVEFLYCRHVLEDIYDPFWVCQEMSRVAKAGYVETPSPIAEVCRGVDGGKPNWRGYHHHRYLIWNDNGVLTFVPKYPIIEHYGLGDAESQVYDLLNQGPLHWNTYFFWNDAIKFRILSHDQEFKVASTYGNVIVDGLQKTIEHHARLSASEDYQRC